MAHPQRTQHRIPSTRVAVWQPAPDPQLAVDSLHDKEEVVAELRERRALRIEHPAHVILQLGGRRRGMLMLHAPAARDPARLDAAEERAGDQATPHPPRLPLPRVAVFGMHPCCMFDGVAGASLRHVAGLFWPDGTADLCDLRTDVGFSVSDRRLAAAHATAGLLVFSVGNGSFLSFPLQAGEQLPSLATLPRALTTDSAHRPPSAPTPEVRDRDRSHAIARHYGRTIVACGDTHDWETAQRPACPRTLVIKATVDELTRGVVLGRYDRCDVHAALEHTQPVSRVHALVLLREDRLLVVDCASTNGTEILGKDDVLKSTLGCGTGEDATWLAPSEAIQLCDHKVLIALKP